MTEKEQKLPNNMSQEEFYRLPKRCQRLCELRNKNNFTQKDIAEKINITVKTYRTWEIGEYKNGVRTFPMINVEALIKLSEIYEVSCDYLLGRTDITKIDNEFINKATGLSEESIEILNKIITNQLSHDFDKIPCTVDFLLQYEFCYGHKNDLSILRNIYDYLFGNFTSCGNNELFIELLDETRSYKREVSSGELDALTISSLFKALMVAKAETSRNEKYKYYGKNVPDDEMLLIAEINEIEQKLEFSSTVLKTPLKMEEEEIKKYLGELISLENKLNILKQLKKY